MAEALPTPPMKQRIYVIARDIQRNDAVGNFCVQIAQLLSNARFDVTLAAENCHPDDRGHIRKMPEALALIEADATVLFQFSTYDPAFPAVAALPNPKIVFFQNITPERFFRGHDEQTADLVRLGLDQRPLCAQFDVIMANSVATAAALVEGLATEEIAAIDPSRIIPCPPIIGVDRWEKIDADQAATKDYSRLILFVGRLVPHKGVDDLIEGFAELAERDPTANLAIVGGPGDSKYAAALKCRVARLDATVATRIEFFHDIADPKLKTLFQQAAVYASMSRHEGFGVPLLDAMFFDKPVVIRSEPGMEETVGGAALVVGTDPSAEDIADALAAAANDQAIQEALALTRAKQLKRIVDRSNGAVIFKAISQARKTRTKPMSD